MERVLLFVNIGRDRKVIDTAAPVGGSSVARWRAPMPEPPFFYLR